MCFFLLFHVTHPTNYYYGFNKWTKAKQKKVHIYFDNDASEKKLDKLSMNIQMNVCNAV